MMTTTDDDLRDLFWRMGMSPAEIEFHLANPYVTTYAKSVLDIVNQVLARRIALRLIEMLFPKANVN